MEKQPKKDYTEHTNLNSFCSILILLTSVGTDALMVSKHKILKAERYFYSKFSQICQVFLEIL